MAVLPEGQLTQAQYSRHRGVTPAAVTKALRAGRIHLTPEGGIDPAAADLAWAANTGVRGGARGPHREGRPLPPAGLREDAITRERLARAKLVELELAERTRELVPAAEVKATWEREVTAARARLLALPSTFRVEIPALTAEDTEKIERMIRTALEDLAR